MTKVTVIFEDNENGSVSGSLEIDSPDKENVVFTPSVMFGEAVMRCMSFNEGEHMWNLVRLFIPEVLKKPDEDASNAERGQP